MNKENLNRDIENIKKKKTQITELKNIITELKNSVERLNSTFHEGKERFINSGQDRGIHLKIGVKRKKNEKELRWLKELMGQ